MDWKQKIQIKILPRQLFGVVLTVLFLLLASMSVFSPRPYIEHVSDYIHIILAVSLMLPKKATWLLLAGWGLFFGGLALELWLGVEVEGIHSYGYGLTGAIPFGIGSIALLVGSVSVFRDSRRTPKVGEGQDLAEPPPNLLS